MKEKKRKSVLDLQASGSIKDQVGPCTLWVPPVDQPLPSFRSMIIKNSLIKGGGVEREGGKDGKENQWSGPLKFWLGYVLSRNVKTPLLPPFLFSVSILLQSSL